MNEKTEQDFMSYEDIQKEEILKQMELSIFVFDSLMNKGYSEHVAVELTRDIMSRVEI